MKLSELKTRPNPGTRLTSWFAVNLSAFLLSTHFPSPVTTQVYDKSTTSQRKSGQGRNALTTH
jgi:hypothetical protein